MKREILLSKFMGLSDLTDMREIMEILLHHGIITKQEFESIRPQHRKVKLQRVK